jgi:hypothetical protein
MSEASRYLTFVHLSTYVRSSKGAIGEREP